MLTLDQLAAILAVLLAFGAVIGLALAVHRLVMSRCSAPTPTLDEGIQPMSSAADDLNAVNTAQTTVSSDQSNVTADQAKLAADQATLATDTTALAAANAQFASDLASGPGVVANADGTFTIYAAAPGTDTGWSSTVVQPLGSLTSVAPPSPAPAPASN